MTAALYGSSGFFRGQAGPAAHFRTSVHASPLLAGAVLRLVERIDAALDHPARLDIIDVGAGRGELLAALHRSLIARGLEPAYDSGPIATATSAPGSRGGGSAPGSGGASALRPWGRAVDGPGTVDGGGAARPLAERVRLVGVEVAGRPAGLDAAIGWMGAVPDGIVGLLIATEWLDNVPLDVAEVDEDGTVRRVLVDPDGTESLGGRVDPADLFWLARWWPLDAEPAGTRAEIGWPRDLAWADAVGAVRRGCALAVDYGHLRAARPPFGTLTGYRDGRQVNPVPDGRSDVTAHLAVDAVAAAAGTPYTLRRQREALRALGVDGGRPPLTLAGSDPAGYVRALAAAGSAAELTDPAGLGGHWWLLHEVGIDARGTILS
jgi:SAM-dependent MidA family methyltransferase